MMRGRLKRSGLRPMWGLVVLTVGLLVAVLVSGWGPKLGLDLEGGFAVTLQPIEDTSEEVLDQSIEVIRARVDALGVAEPEITRQGSTIEVSLPGVTDRERARELVGQTAELRFRPVLSAFPGSIEDLLASTTTTAEGETTTTAADGDPTTTAEDATATTAEVSGQSAAAPAAPFQDTTTTAPGGTTTTTTGEPGDLGLELTPREEDVAEEPVTLGEYDDDGNVVFTYQLGPAVATGQIVGDARAELSPTGEWTVALEIKGSDIDDFNADAAAPCFSRLATCPTQQLAIVLDSRVVMAPTIQQPSYERDQIQISGNLTEGEAKDLALVLRYGSLPVALEIQQTREVSATLGSDSLRAGVVSGLVGLALVTLYMVGYYRLLGLVAMASLAVSAGLLWVVIAWMGETRDLALTLAGITGIIVSIGVAVDSNVVFYENLKEEVWRGRTPRSAATGSFGSAFSTIVKANVATLIGAVLLYLLTVGSVRGFALFLAIGTVLDMIASYWFMRPLVMWLVRSRRYLERPQVLGLTTPGAPS
ncbi:MAG: protein translocase subunit SecD [Acidimicrobiia bacterium]